jgi:hypothetical protein
MAAVKPVIVSTWRRQSWHAVEAAGQSWEAGDVVTLDASGDMIVAANTSALVLGLAQADATGTTGAACTATPLFPGDIIQIDTYDVSDTAILDAADFIPGTLYGLVVAAGEWYADFDKGVGTAIADAVIFIAPQGTLKEEIAGDVVYRGLFRMAGAILVQHTGV